MTRKMCILNSDTFFLRTYVTWLIEYVTLKPLNIDEQLYLHKYFSHKTVDIFTCKVLLS